MAKAVWNEKVLAESNRTIELENNVYFPPDSINKEYFGKSGTISMCPWKGQARYLSVQVGEEVNKDCAWYYPDPSEKAQDIKNYIAFRNDVEIVK